MTALQRARAVLGLTQAQVADQLQALAWHEGFGQLGIDANAVSRHERGVIARPRDPLPELYARLYDTPITALWPAVGSGEEVRVERRQFIKTTAGLATALAAGDLVADDDLASLKAITAGLQHLEATTPAAELQGPVLAHLRLLRRRADRGPGYAAAAAEVARLSAWLAWDQRDDDQARALYQRAVGFAERSRQDELVAHMLGSWALWAAEIGQGGEAVRVAHRIPSGVPGPWLATMQATVAASAGNADQALASLRTAEAELDLDGIPLTPASLAGYRGRCAVMLRLPKTAAPALREALAADPPARHRGLLLATLARVVDPVEGTMLRGKARTIGRKLGSRRVLAEAR